MTVLIYENDYLFIENQEGLRWRWGAQEAPKELSEKIQFQQLYCRQDVQFRVLNGEKIALNPDEIRLIHSYVRELRPPEGVTMQKQHQQDVYEKADEIISDVCRELGFQSMSEILVISRPESKNLKKDIAVKYLEFVDYMFNNVYKIQDNIKQTTDDGLMPIVEYWKQLPKVPPMSYFYANH